MQGANSKNKTIRIKIKSHSMSIVKMQSVAPVHFRVGRCHQMKKRHRMWLLSKVFTDLEKVFSLKWVCPPREAFHWRRGERSIDPAVRPIVECSIGVSPGQAGPSAALCLTLELGSGPQAPLTEHWFPGGEILLPLNIPWRSSYADNVLPYKRFLKNQKLYIVNLIKKRNYWHRTKDIRNMHRVK